MDTIIWLDGHTTTISSEEAFRKEYKVCTDEGNDFWSDIYMKARLI